ncbi:MAG: type II toxin-antitoxin system HicA family toxin [Chloroflexi bacterium]|nr:type II toxin-antitoxin system HicA family toxin [Chloroflexota bacterium]MBM3174580.1 type II toxin-antitoxin system HicA family toxin [Chloroflexota bacterium]MBM4449340.1 type II toxin-antitoxin system HicA family toxin [Chloroflexota bacterium]
MSRWRRCKRRDFVNRLKKLGFIGPYSGTKHQFMVCGQHRLAIPSNSEYSVPQLRIMLQEVEQILGRHISAEDWECLK